MVSVWRVASVKSDVNVSRWDALSDLLLSPISDDRERGGQLVLGDLEATPLDEQVDGFVEIGISNARIYGPYPQPGSPPHS